MKAISGVCREDSPHDVDEKYGAGTYARLFPEDDTIDEDEFKCPTCGGRGTVNPLTAPDDFFCTGTTTCPDCDGMGEI